MDVLCLLCLLFMFRSSPNACPDTTLRINLFSLERSWHRPLRTVGVNFKVAVVFAINARRWLTGKPPPRCKWRCRYSADIDVTRIRVPLLPRGSLRSFCVLHLRTICTYDHVWLIVTCVLVYMLTRTHYLFAYLHTYVFITNKYYLLHCGHFWRRREKMLPLFSLAVRGAARGGGAQGARAPPPIACRGRPIGPAF